MQNPNDMMGIRQHSNADMPRRREELDVGDTLSGKSYSRLAVLYLAYPT